MHNDKDVSDVEKLRFLSQCMVEKSRAADVVNGFPPSGDNYIAAIESLKSRFGRHDLLVEVYMRDLHKLVASKPATLTMVYDKLETHLRALETLGITSDMCAVMLFPLIESLLPEDVLPTWSRQMNQFNTMKEKLEGLMKFLEKEVQNEEIITLVRIGFQPNNWDKKGKSGNSDAGKQQTAKSRIEGQAEIATASALLNGEKNVSFAFSVRIQIMRVRSV